MIEVVVEIEYTRDAWRSLGALSPKDLARQLRYDLDALKIPHPPEETISRKSDLNTVRFSWTKPRGSYLHRLIQDLVHEQDISSTKETKRRCSIKEITLMEEKPRHLSERETNAKSHHNSNLASRRYPGPIPSGPSNSFPGGTKSNSNRFVELTVHITYTPEKAEALFGRPDLSGESNIDKKEIASRLKRDLDLLGIPNPRESSISVNFYYHTVRFSWTTKENSPLYRFLNNLISIQRSDEIVKKAKKACNIERIRVIEEQPTSLETYRPNSKPRSPSPHHPVPHARHGEQRSLSSELRDSNLKGSQGLSYFFPHMRRESTGEERPLTLARSSDESISAPSTLLRQSLPLTSQPRLPSSNDSMTRKDSILRIETVQSKLLQLGQDSSKQQPNDSELPFENMLDTMGTVEYSFVNQEISANDVVSKTLVESPVEVDLPVNEDVEEDVKLSSARSFTSESLVSALPFSSTSVNSLPVPPQSSAPQHGTPLRKPQISQLTREFWDTRRNLTALSSRGALLQVQLQELGVVDQYHSQSTQADLESNLSLVETRLAEERRTCERLERLLSDVQKECDEPVIIPALLAALGQGGFSF